MRLGKLLKKISWKRKQPELEDRELAEDIYKATSLNKGDEGDYEMIERQILKEQSADHETVKVKRRKDISRLILGASIIGSFLLISLLGIFYVHLKDSAFKEEKVSVSISGPEKMLIGEEKEFEILIKNENRVDLKNVSLKLVTPDSLEIEDNPSIIDKGLFGARIMIGDLAGHHGKKYIIKTRAKYNEDEKSWFKVFLKYQPENISSEFETNALKNIHFDKPAIDISVISPETVSVQELVSLDVVVKNNENVNLNGGLLEIEYPKGFEYNDSSREVVSGTNNSWLFGSVVSGGEEKVTITGRIFGAVDSIKKFKIRFYQSKDRKILLSQGEKVLKISPSKILLKQVSKSKDVLPGEYLEYDIFFKNNSEIALRDLILKAYLPKKYIDKKTVLAGDGYYDDQENVIIWKASAVEKLKLLQPGEEGKVSFQVKLIDRIVPANKKDKNIFTLSHSEIESLHVDSPIFKNKKILSPEVKTMIGSVVNMVYGARCLGEDGQKLQVNKESKIKISFKIYNSTSKLRSAILTANLPPGVRLLEVLSPNGDNFYFNERTNELEWDLGVVDMGTGYLSPPEKAEFVIGIKPSLNQEGQIIELIRNINISAKDVYTDKAIQFNLKVIDSGMIEGLDSALVVGE